MIWNAKTQEKLLEERIAYKNMHLYVSKLIILIKSLS